MKKVAKRGMTENRGRRNDTYAIILVAVFALIGIFFVWRSIAAVNPNLSGDLNGDNKVTIADLSILLTNYNRTTADADLNGDGKVTVADLSKLLTNYGKTYTPTTPPATPPTTPPSTPPTTPPAGNDGPTAAAKLGWGNVVWGDEFNYGSPSALADVDTSKWSTPNGCFAGHNGNGQRCTKNSKVDGSKMIMTGDTNGDTGWLKSKDVRTYGRWEVRSRSYDVGNSGQEYHPLYIIWPNNDDWPGNGEYDWIENEEVGADHLKAYIHYPHPNMPVQQEMRTKQGVDMSQWHNFAFEWTSAGVKGYVDGEEWFSLSGGAGPGGRKNIQDMKDGALTIQLDNFTGAGGLKGAKFETDWVRVYNVN